MEEVLNLSLTVQETNVVLTALSELPYKVAVELIAKVQQQAQEQLNKAAEGEE